MLILHKVRFALNALHSRHYRSTPFPLSFPVHGHRGTPNVGQPPIPPQAPYPSGPLPTSQPIQGSVQTRPVFPTPQVQHPHMSTTSGPPPPPPPPPIVQWSESTHMPGNPHNYPVASGNPHNYPVASGHYPSTSSQVPITMSHSLSEHAGTSGVAHNFPSVPRTRACILTAYYLRILSNLRRDLSRGRLEYWGTCRWPRRSGNVPSRPPPKGTANRWRFWGAEMSKMRPAYSRAILLKMQVGWLRLRVSQLRIPS